MFLFKSTDYNSPNGFYVLLMGQSTTAIDYSNKTSSLDSLLYLNKDH